MYIQIFNCNKSISPKSQSSTVDGLYKCEYHFFETQDIRGGGGNVAYVLRDSVFVSVLAPQWVRAGRPYTYAPDINGDFRINTFQGVNPHTEADYSSVVFSLFAEDFLFDADHFVVGDFNQHIKSEENKLSYNPETERFEASIAQSGW